MPIPRLPLNPTRPDRQGKRTIAFHVDQELFRKFAMVKAKYLATTEQMGVIALGLLFKHFAPEDGEARRESGDERAPASSSPARDQG